MWWFFHKQRRPTEVYKQWEKKEYQGTCRFWISGRAITEDEVAKKVQEYTENVRKNKPKTTKP